jgi:hypothetical protein
MTDQENQQTSQETPQETLNVRTYSNHKITLESNWEFTVTGPEFDDERYAIMFKSYFAAREEIDKRVADKVALESKNLKFSLTVLDLKGTRIETTSINRRTGALNGVTTKRFFPNVPWIAASLIRLNTLHEEIKQIENALVNLTMETSRSYGRIDAESYGRRILQLKETYNEKLTLAKEREKLQLQETQKEEAANDQKAS